MFCCSSKKKKKPVKPGMEDAILFEVQPYVVPIQVIFHPIEVKESRPHGTNEKFEVFAGEVSSIKEEEEKDSNLETTQERIEREKRNNLLFNSQIQADVEEKLEDDAKKQELFSHESVEIPAQVEMVQNPDDQKGIEPSIHLEGEDIEKAIGNDNVYDEPEVFAGGADDFVDDLGKRVKKGKRNAREAKLEEEEQKKIDMLYGEPENMEDAKRKAINPHLYEDDLTNLQTKGVRKAGEFNHELLYADAV